MASSAIVQVKDGSGSWVDTDNGVDVTPGNLISMRLKTPGSVTKWQLECFGTDEVTAVAPSMTNVNPVDNQVTTPSTTVTFTMPAGAGVGRALVFRSTVDDGGAGLVTTFGIFTLTDEGDRVGAINETREGSIDFGWVLKVNPLIRRGSGGGGAGLPALANQQYAILMEDPAGALVFQQITQDMIQPAFDVTMAGSQVVEVGETVPTPAFTASYTGGPATSVLLTDSEGTPSKNVTGTPTAFSSNGSFTKTAVSAAVTFTITASKNAIQKTSNASITWLPKVFYGVAVPAAYTEAFIEALATSALDSSRARSFSVNAGASEKVYYAYPTSFGDGTFFVGGFEGGFNKVASAVDVTNPHGVTLAYDLWESTNVNLGSTNVTVT